MKGGRLGTRQISPLSDLKGRSKGLTWNLQPVTPSPNRTLLITSLFSFQCPNFASFLKFCPLDWVLKGSFGTDKAGVRQGSQKEEKEQTARTQGGAIKHNSFWELFKNPLFLSLPLFLSALLLPSLPTSPRSPSPRARPGRGRSCRSSSTRRKRRERRPKRYQRRRQRPKR